MKGRWNALAASALGMAAVLLPVGASSGAAVMHGGAAIYVPHGLVPQGLSQFHDSTNWSGYAETGAKGSYTSVGGSWTVPKASATSGRSTYSSAWIGIDGATNSSLIQTGTDTEYVNGKAHYDAWWEILPADAKVIPSLTISPGDSMTGLITKGSPSWTITITDNTTKKSFTILKAYTGPATSIDWIVERPEVNGSQSSLARYGSVTFTGATVNGANAALKTADEYYMFRNSSNTTIISIPGAPNAAGNSFTVAHGAVAPPAPASSH